jgi:Ca2+-binding EF-hand superfamily protein
MFDICVKRICDENTSIILFPEGETYTRPTLQELKTGAARLAITLARNADATKGRRVPIIPVGLTYTHPSGYRLRQGVLVDFGHAINITDEQMAIANSGEDGEKKIAKEITESLEKHLKGVTINLPDWVEELEKLTRAKKMDPPEYHLVHPKGENKVGVVCSVNDTEYFSKFYDPVDKKKGKENEAKNEFKSSPDVLDRELKRLFKEADTDNSGTIDPKELSVLMSKIIQRRPTSGEVKELLKKFDAQGGQITWEKFRDNMAQWVIFKETIEKQNVKDSTSFQKRVLDDVSDFLGGVLVREKTIDHGSHPIVLQKKKEALTLRQKRQAARRAFFDISKIENVPDADWEIINTLHMVRRLYKPDDAKLTLSQYALITQRLIDGYFMWAGEEKVKAVWNDVVKYEKKLKQLNIKDAHLRYQVVDKDGDGKLSWDEVREGLVAQISKTAQSTSKTLILQTMIGAPLSTMGEIFHAPIALLAYAAGKKQRQIDNAKNNDGDRSVEATVKLLAGFVGVCIQYPIVAYCAYSSKLVNF